MLSWRAWTVWGFGSTERVPAIRQVSKAFRLKLSFLTELGGSLTLLVKSSNNRVATLPLPLRKRLTLVRTMRAGLGVLGLWACGGFKEPFSRSLPCWERVWWGLSGGYTPLKALWVKLRCLDKSNDNRNGQETLFREICNWRNWQGHQLNVGEISKSKADKYP